MIKKEVLLRLTNTIVNFPSLPTSHGCPQPNKTLLNYVVGQIIAGIERQQIGYFELSNPGTSERNDHKVLFLKFHDL